MTRVFVALGMLAFWTWAGGALTMIVTDNPAHPVGRVLFVSGTVGLLTCLAVGLSVHMIVALWKNDL